MVKAKIWEWIGIIASLVAVMGLGLYIIDLHSKTNELAGKLHNIEIERQNLLQIRESYIGLVVNIASKRGDISKEELLAFLPAKEVEKLKEKLSTDNPRSLRAPFDMTLYFYPSGRMGDGELREECIRLKTSFQENLRTGDNDNACIKVSYQPGPIGWAGIYWQYPDSNWGDQAGTNIEGATRIAFWAKGESGREIVEFKAGGIRAPKSRYRDSFEISKGRIQLTREWRRYEISLAGQNLSQVIGGFAWVATEDANPTGLTFYLDDIRYE